MNSIKLKCKYLAKQIVLRNIFIKDRIISEKIRYLKKKKLAIIRRIASRILNEYDKYEIIEMLSIMNNINDLEFLEKLERQSKEDLAYALACTVFLHNYT